MNKNKLGLLYGVSAFVIWGMFPLYWPHLKPATPAEIVSHRAVWTSILCILILAFTKQLRGTLHLLKNPKVMFTLTASTVMISINWLVYIWAVNNDHVVESALGYYINPLVNIALGTIFLHEKMRKLQWISVIIASFGAFVLTIDYGRIPWIAFALAISWGTYGFLKKRLGLGALQGLGIETTISLIPYFYYLSTIEGQFGKDFKISTLLIGAGIVTTIPLLFFNGAATRLPYSTMGLLQYITPSLQFILGVWVFHESMPFARWIGFFVIWIALVVLAMDLFKSSDSIDN